jgi:hypothetical protein
VPAEPSHHARRKAAWAQIALGFCAATLLVLTPESAAAAKRQQTVLRRSLSLEMSLAGSNGYLLNVSTAGHREVQLRVRKGPYIAVYRTAGSVSRHHVDADLGDLGRISVRFHGSRKAEPESHSGRCSGRRPVHEVGVFNGTIEFAGEQGYTDASARHARGSVRRTYRQVCPPRQHPGTNSVGISLPRRNQGPRGFDVTILSARSRSAARIVAFDAIRVDAGGNAEEPARWVLDAGTFEHIGAVAASKFVISEASPAAVQVSARGVHPASAQAAPPLPFQGTASFLEGAVPGPSWTGTLNVWLPGLGATPLAGDPFKAVLCHSTSVRRLAACVGPTGAQTSEASPLGRPQISGSQSQLFADARLSWLR